MRVWGVGCRVKSVGFRVCGFGCWFRILGVGCRCRVKSEDFMACAVGCWFRIEGVGCRM